jgi:predicted esterase
MKMESSVGRVGRVGRAKIAIAVVVCGAAAVGACSTRSGLVEQARAEAQPGGPRSAGPSGSEVGGPGKSAGSGASSDAGGPGGAASLAASPVASPAASVEASPAVSVEARGVPAVGAASARGASAMTALAFEGGNGALYAPEAGGVGPITVYLHGMCASGQLECPAFASASRAGWLVCPDGNVSCQGGGFMWAGMPRPLEARIDAALAALRATGGAQVGEGPMAIVGYSLGAPAAMLQVMREPYRYDRLMIVNASMEPSVAQMKRAGVRRVALVAGERDATVHKLRAAALRLAGGGVDARFFALAATDHYFNATSQAQLAAPLAWLLAPSAEGSR